MSSVVLDASALLALLYREPGAEMVAGFVRGSAISAVNLSEVVAKLCIEGLREHTIRGIIAPLGLEVVPFDDSQAYHCGLLNESTKSAGLSLGDRACLSLARKLNLRAVTTDRVWANLTVGVDITVIR